MRIWNGFSGRPSASLLASLSLCLFSGSAKAQESLDPSDIWYRAFLLVQSADEMEEHGRHLEALNKLNEAGPLFDHLAQQFPDFQTELIRGRRHLLAVKRDELKMAMRNVPAPSTTPSPAFPLPGVATPGVATPGVATRGLPSGAGGVPTVAIAPPPIPPLGGGGARVRTMSIEDDGGEFVLPSWDDGASRTLPQMDPASGMPRVETRNHSIGAIATSLHDDLSKKDALISWLNDENQKLKNELQQRDQILQHVNAELSRAQGSRDELMKRIAAAESQGGIEAAQRVEQLKTLLRDATEQLETATERNAQLVAAMEQAESEMAKMRERMTELERERDNLVEVVNGEGMGGKALKELMDRNRKLTEQLDRAEQLAESLSELNKEKDDDIALLKTELTRIKLERDQLVTQNARHQQSIDELQHKLEALSDGLSDDDRKALASATPVERQENELLRSIVLKQLRRQAQMKQAKELLLKQLDQVGARSDTLLGLVEDIARGSQLSEEEKALFKAPQFQEIIEAASVAQIPGITEIAPVAEDESDNGAAVMTATLVAAGNAPSSPNSISPDAVIERQKLTVELAQIDKAARLDFKEGRYAESEAGFLEYLRYLPQNVPCLCNLGVLKTTMKNYSEAEYFLEKAIAIDGKSALANYLLGRVYFLQDKLDEALSKLETGLTYDSQNAKAHNCVGVISTRKGWVGRAERAFTNAVSIDPEYGDAHFNLALLHASKDQPNPQEAGKHYFRALHLGIPRDATIEGFLKEAEEAGTAVGMR